MLMMSIFQKFNFFYINTVRNAILSMLGDEESKKLHNLMNALSQTLFLYDSPHIKQRVGH